MFRRVALRTAAVAATLAAAGTTGPGAGHAAPTPTPAGPTCHTVTTRLVNRPDVGHGTGGVGILPSYWADDTILRTVTICHVTTPRTADVAGQVVAGWRYHAVAHDAGTFITRGGPTLSPNNGKPLTAGIPGTLVGQFQVDFTAAAAWVGFHPTLNHATVVGDPRTSPTDANPTTGDWVKSMWTTGFHGVGDPTGFDPKTWWWRYVTCRGEQWWDAAAPASDDGQTDGKGGAGDILGLGGGRYCPSPHPSPVRSASASPSPVTVPGQLPVTGAPTVWLTAGGLLLTGTGATIVGWLYRRRPRFTT